MGSLCEEKILQRTETSPFRLCSLCSAVLPPRGNFFGSFAPWDFFFFLFPPFRWAGEAGRVSGCTLVTLPPLPLDLGPARGVGVPLGIRLAWAGSLPLLLLLREEEERQTSISRVSESVDSPQFSPHVPRRENLRESSASCSRALSSRDSRSSGREPRKDKRARSRESSSRGRRRRSCSSSRSRSRGRERERRSSSASRSSRGRSRRERSRSSDRYHSRRGSSRSRRDRSRSSDRYRARRDRSRRERSRSIDRYRSRRERARSPARRGVQRDRTLPRIARGQAGDYLLLLPARGPRKRDDWPDEEPRRVWRRLPPSLLWLLEWRWMLLLLQEGHP